jgi:hypothetical protein
MIKVQFQFKWSFLKIIIIVDLFELAEKLMVRRGKGYSDYPLPSQIHFNLQPGSY